jgi:hypothetical protein
MLRGIPLISRDTKSILLSFRRPIATRIIAFANSVLLPLLTNMSLRAGQKNLSLEKSRIAI